MKRLASELERLAQEVRAMDADPLAAALAHYGISKEAAAVGVLVTEPGITVRGLADRLGVNVCQLYRWTTVGALLRGRRAEKLERFGRRDVAI